MGWMLGPLMIVGALAIRRRHRLDRGSARLSRCQTGCGGSSSATASRSWASRRPRRAACAPRTDGAAPAAGHLQPARLRLHRRSLGRAHLALAVRDGRAEAPADPQLLRAARKPAAASCRATRSRRMSPASFAGPLLGHGRRRARCRRQPDRRHRRTGACTTPGRA